MAGRASAPSSPLRETIRLDKWLWQARFWKTRGLAAEAVQDGAVRLNGARCLKPGHAVAAGDTLTFVFGGAVRVVRVLAPGLRRGPAAEAQTLYEDLSAPPAEPDRRGPDASAPSPLE